MAELPFQAEYAKSGRASCKGCKQKIDQGTLRIAIMVQSAFFDGKQPNWHHEECFFKKARAQTIADIANFNKLRNPDKERIKKAIEANTGIAMPVAKGKGKKGKRAADNGGGVNLALKDFAVEYSKSSRATCAHCEIKICKDEVRICKILFDTEVGKKFGGQPIWHHVPCFEQVRDNLAYMAGGEDLPGFNNLKKEDQKVVKAAIKPRSVDDLPIKKLKMEPKDEEDIKKEKDHEKLLAKQNKLFHKYRSALSEYKKSDLHELMEANSMEIPVSGADVCLDRLADVMAFGVPEPCPECKGELVLDTFNYKCTGSISEWTKCSYTTTEPKKTKFKVPKAFKESSAFHKYRPSVAVRAFDAAPPPPLIIKKEEPAEKKNIPIPPLKNLQFFIYGKSKSPKEELKHRILKLGGLVVSKLTDTIAAVVSTKHDVDKMGSKMSEIQEADIEVVEESFLDLIDPATGTVAKTLELIKMNNIADWGSDPAKRVPQDVIDGKSIPKSGSLYVKSGKSSTKKLKIKGGTAVDPDSGLEDVAHVYKDEEGTKYTVVLCRTDVVEQKNSYYKLQVLEADNKKKYWLFRSWGRIGTTIGGNKTEDCRSLEDAVRKFEDLYMEKTENPWECRDDFMKVPGGYHPIEVDYGDDDTDGARSKLQVDKNCKLPEPVQKLVVTIFDIDVMKKTLLEFEVDYGDDDTDGARRKLQVDKNCKLPEPVQKLVVTIFDIDVMKKTLLEFKLDTEKMPLGKLSKKQIKSGYKVLTELLKYIEQGQASENKIKDATNRFFTTVPHDFGVNNAPLLDSVDAIKKKAEMLDNLLEIEIAYSLLKTDSDDTTSPIEQHYSKLKAHIAPLDKTSEEFHMILEYVSNTHAATHSAYTLEVEEVFKVVREGEDKRYKPFKKLHNRRLLWHGSRVTNFAGILSQGLRIAPPEAPVTGYMFGKGVYFADMVSKSANYCCTSRSSPTGIMLLCEVALGDMKKCHQAEMITKLPPGLHSAWGVGRTQPNPEQARTLPDGTLVPLGKPVTDNKLNTSLLYNEFIVYDVAQVNVKYLLQMKFNHKY